MKKGDVVCFKGDRSAIATITMVATKETQWRSWDKGAFRASLIWLTGPKVGTKRECDMRDLIMVEEAE